MSYGNYDLTIATTSDALTEDDVILLPGQEKTEISDRLISPGSFLHLRKLSIMSFSSKAGCCVRCCKQDNYFSILNRSKMKLLSKQLQRHWLVKRQQ